MGLVMLAAGGPEEAARIPEPLELLGTYDLTATDPATGRRAVGVGWVTSDDDEVFVQLSYPAIAMQGMLARDGSLQLAGATTDGDGIRQASASGTARTRDGVHVIALAITAPAAVHVVLTRPVDADLSTARGRFRLALTGPGISGCAGNAILDVEVPMDSSGSAAVMGTWLGTDETAIGSVRFGFVDVAPGGQFHFEAEYVAAEELDAHEAIGPAAQLRINGAWPLDFRGAGHGTYELASGIRTMLEAGDVTITRLA